MALLSAVTEHNYQADLFSKLSPLLCLWSVYPSVGVELSAVCFDALMPVSPPPIIPISAASVCFSLLTPVSLSETVYLVLLLLYTPSPRQPFSVLLFALPADPHSLISLLPHHKSSFPRYISPPLLRTSALPSRCEIYTSTVSL